MSLITIIGRGNSGTRLLSHTLYASGIYMGHRLNYTGDKLPAQEIYAAARLFGTNVSYLGDLKWNLSEAINKPIPDEARQLIESYLSDVLQRPDQNKGWKIPETTLIFPWITRMYPDCKYISIVRDPRDVIGGSHFTDTLADFGVTTPQVDNVMEQRAISWLYQYELVKATPRPTNWISIKFEDFLLDQDTTLTRLEEFLEIPLGRIVTRPEAAYRWKKKIQPPPDFPFLHAALDELNYER